MYWISGQTLNGAALRDGSLAWSKHVSGPESGWSIELTERCVLAFPGQGRRVENEIEGLPLVLRRRDSGDLVPLLPGIMTFTFSLNLDAKPYYLAWISHGSFSARCWQGSYFLDTLGIKATTTLNSPLGYLTYSKSYGALPNLSSDNTHTLNSYGSGYFVATAIR